MKTVDCGHGMAGRGAARLLTGALAAALVAGTSGCILDSDVVNVGMQDKSTELPKAADNVVRGRVEGAVSGATLSVYTGSGGRIEAVSGTSDAAGNWELRFPGNTEYAGLRVMATWPGGQALGVLPPLPRQVSVMDPDRVIDLDQALPLMATLGNASTTAALILVGKALDEGRTLASLPQCVLAGQVADLAGRLGAGSGKVGEFQTLVAGLAGSGTAAALAPFAGELGTGAVVADLLDPSFAEVLCADNPDFDLCANPAGGVRSAREAQNEFAKRLGEAAKEVKGNVQYATDTVRVVFLADHRKTARDGNCATVDLYKWAADKVGSQMFFTGGVHESAPLCGSGFEAPYCVDQARVDAANQALGNWVPNQVAMYDDGTHGDAVKGDEVWTFVVDLPLVPLAGSPHGRGMRIGYKFTWGAPGQGWTNSEEWPGNQRILELVDLNGDGLVVRLDTFADEAGNKDKANALKPANGGCPPGKNLWEADEVPAMCGSTWHHDTRERMVDLDGDARCLPDGWPSAGSVSPITLACE